MANGYGSAARVAAAEQIKGGNDITDYVTAVDRGESPEPSAAPGALSDSDKSRLASIAESHGVTGPALGQLTAIVEEFMAGEGAEVPEEPEEAEEPAEAPPEEEM